MELKRSEDRIRPSEAEDVERFRMWYWAIKQPGRTLEQTLAEEVALYFGKSVDEVMQFWYTSTESSKKNGTNKTPERTRYYKVL